jgi:type II secretory pathway pseudopilin PulG
VKRRTAGFTLLELAVSTGLLGLVVGSALAMSMAGRNAFTQANASVSANAKVRRALERAVSELNWAGADTLSNCSAGASTVSFQPLESVAGGVAIWGPTRRLQLVPSANDPDDGIDNDGDGVIDECDLVLTIDVGGAGERSITLCTQVTEMFPGETLNGLDDNGNAIVDERGFNVESVGDFLTVRLSVAEPGENDRTTASSITTSITLRN